MADSWGPELDRIHHVYGSRFHMASPPPPCPSGSGVKRERVDEKKGVTK